MSTRGASGIDSGSESHELQAISTLYIALCNQDIRLNALCPLEYSLFLRASCAVASG